MEDGEPEPSLGGKQRGPHTEKRLSAAFVRSALPGRHTDGGGLFLQVDKSGARRWLTQRVKPGEVFHSQWLLQYAPDRFRKKETLSAAIATLVERGWLTPQPSGTVVDGAPRKQSFCLHPDATW